jgi:hypothetical protein
MFGNLPPAPKYGLFVMGQNMQKYFWAGDTIATTTQLPTGFASGLGFAVGNSTLAIIGKGTANGVQAAHFIHASATTATIGNLATSVSYCAYGCTPTSAIVTVGGTSGSRSLLFVDFASETSAVSGSQLTFLAAQGGGAGNSSIACFTFSGRSGGNSAVNNLYTHSSGAVAVGNVFTVTINSVSSSFGNKDVGIFFRSTTAGNLSSQKCTYASDTKAVGGTLAQTPTLGFNGCSSETFGVSYGGTVSQGNKYFYASDTCVAPPSLTMSYSSGGSSISNGTTGVNA